MPTALRTDTPLRARLLATIAEHQRGDLAAAVAGYRDVLAQEPRSFDAQRLLGAALLALDRCDEAVEHFDLALALRADFAEVWTLRADALARVQRQEAAVASYERGLALRPQDAGAWNNLGLQYLACRRTEAALAAFDRAVALAPEVAVAWTNRGIAQGRLGRGAEALASHAQALQLAPGSAPIWCNYGQAQHELGQHDAAIASYDRALQLPSDSVPAAWLGRAAALRALGRSDDALQSCARALAASPGDATAWALQGAVLADLQRTVDALDCFDRALRLAPDDAETRFNRGLALLTLGRYEAGWRDYEWRHRVPRLSTGGVATVPQWDGSQELAGRTLLLTCEQGLGDAIQFFRFVPLMADRGARVVLAVPPALRPLLDRMEGSADVLTLGDPLPALDLQCHLLSLPHRLRLALEDVPARTPYLRVPADHLQRWRERLDAARPAHEVPRHRIGLVCSGNPRHANDRNRSIALEHLAPLVARLQAQACEWHLLQDALRPHDEPWLQRLGVVDHRAQLSDLLETGALACCMDAIVSVDTAVAHLAGALGRPLYLLLPVASDWRWLLGRSDSPWYPSAHLFRQRDTGRWEEPLALLTNALADALAGQPRQSDASPAVAPPQEGSLLARASDLHRSGQRGDAIGLYREILRRNASIFDAHRLLGAALVQEQRYEEALAVLEAALDRFEHSGEVWALHGRALAELGRRTEALGSFERSLALRPDRASVWTEQGHQLQDLGRPREALASFERAVQLEPGNARYRFHLSTAQLALGDYAAGWAGYEARRQVPEMRMQAAVDSPFWDGRAPLEGCKLLVCAEQGLGDTIQMSRYVQMLAKRGARVVLGAQAPLARLLRSLDGVGIVVGEGEALPSVDLQCWIMSLPHLLGTTPDSVPATVPYLHPDPARVAHWRAALESPAAAQGPRPRPRRIGIALRGNPKQANDRHRSLALETFAAVVGDGRDWQLASGIQWHLLQPQVAGVDEPWIERLGIVDHRPALFDLGETAALASCMDAVVSVDSAVAHLAGALGLPLYVLLAVNADWRWTSLRPDSAWYPTARLVRQTTLGDWEGPLAQLRELLRHG